VGSEMCIRDRAIRALPNSGYQFSGWSGDASGTTNPITITMNSEKSIKANFSPISTADKGDGDSGGGGLCFIATAAYGSPTHPHVKTLRDFRDNYLITNKLGRALVNLYYKYSTFVANVIVRYKPLKTVVQIHLLPVIVFCYSMVHLGPIVTGGILLLILVLPISLMFARRRK